MKKNSPDNKVFSRDIDEHHTQTITATDKFHIDPVCGMESGRWSSKVSCT